MALPSRAVVQAYAETYTEEEIKRWRRDAMEAHTRNLPRVELTSVSLEGGGGTGEFIDKDPVELIELFTAVLARIEAGNCKRVNRGMSHADFSRRPIGW